MFAKMDSLRGEHLAATTKKLNKFRYWKLLVSLYAVILFFMNFVRIFDNNFWGDEAFTVNLVKYSIPEIIEKTAADVHPPLYYLFVKLVYTILGNLGWAYHLVSLIPCAIILFFSLTVIWKNFGWPVSVILITFAGLSDNAVCFNVEVRMYSWGALFVLLSYYCFYRILESDEWKNYLFFMVASLAAAYTHYYCLISVAFFYIALLIYSLLSKKSSIRKILAVYVATIVGYLPWFFIMLQSMLNRIDNYWITYTPGFRESIRYLFSNQMPSWMLLFIAFLGMIAVFYETGILKIENDELGKHHVKFSFATVQCSNILIIIIVGLLSIIGTISFGILVSYLIRPFYGLRYIYPVSIVAWLLLGLILSKLKGGKIYTIIFVLVMLIVFYPDYKERYITDKIQNEELELTLEATTDIDTKDVILTNHEHIDLYIAQCYYPGVETSLISLGEIPELNPDLTYWLIISETKELDRAFVQIKEQGFTYKQVVDTGNLGTHTVSIYKIVYNEGGN